MYLMKSFHLFYNPLTNYQMKNTDNEIICYMSVGPLIYSTGIRQRANTCLKKMTYNLWLA